MSSRRRSVIRMHQPMIAEYLARTVAERENERALGFIRDGELHWRTWREVWKAAGALAAELRASNVAAGDRVTQVSENRYEWVITDLALHLIGAVHVPIHMTLSGQQIAEQIEDCGAKVVFISNRELLAKFVGGLSDAAAIRLHDEIG